MNAQDKTVLCAAWNAYLEKGHLVSKFVPASGAASRMFKDLFEWLNQKEHTLESAFIQQFFNGLKQFAFYDELQKACLSNEKMDIDHLMQSGLHHLVVENLLTAKGLNYGSLPKGLLTFHAYPNGNRKAVIEHLVEGALYASSQGVVNIHFTVSPHGVAYYLLDTKIQSDLSITTERGKENVNLFSNIEGVNAWCSITEDPNPKEPCWRISIRSKRKDISGVANNWGGGGHAQASGAKIADLSELDQFIKDLDDLF